jgi:hypothetical protein
MVIEYTRKGNFLRGLYFACQETSHQTKAKIGTVTPDTFVWYGEHDHVADPRKISGAVVACSTQDFVRGGVFLLERALFQHFSQPFSSSV